MIIHPCSKFSGGIAKRLLELGHGILDIIMIIMVLKFDGHLGSAAAEMPVNFQSDWKFLTPNLAASRFHEILR